MSLAKKLHPGRFTDMVYVAWRVRNMYVAMVVHVAASTIGMIGLLAVIVS